MGFPCRRAGSTANCPTAQVADWHIVAAYDDVFALEEMARRSDVITYEFEECQRRGFEFDFALCKYSPGELIYWQSPKIAC